MEASVQYEILLAASKSSIVHSDWTWQRLEIDGSVSASGSRHETLASCYREVNQHKRACGDADIAVNLLGTIMSEPQASAGLSTGERADLILPPRRAPFHRAAQRNR